MNYESEYNKILNKIIEHTLSSEEYDPANEITQLIKLKPNTENEEIKSEIEKLHNHITELNRNRDRLYGIFQDFKEKLESINSDDKEFSDLILLMQSQDFTTLYYVNDVALSDSSKNKLHTLHLEWSEFMIDKISLLISEYSNESRDNIKKYLIGSINYISPRKIGDEKPVRYINKIKQLIQSLPKNSFLKYNMDELYNQLLNPYNIRRKLLEKYVKHHKLDKILTDFQDKNTEIYSDILETYEFDSENIFDTLYQLQHKDKTKFNEVTKKLKGMYDDIVTKTKLTHDVLSLFFPIIKFIEYIDTNKPTSPELNILLEMYDSPNIQTTILNKYMVQAGSVTHVECHNIYQKLNVEEETFDNDDFMIMKNSKSKNTWFIPIDSHFLPIVNRPLTSAKYAVFNEEHNSVYKLEKGKPVKLIIKSLIPKAESEGDLLSSSNLSNIYGSESEQILDIPFSKINKPGDEKK